MILVSCCSCLCPINWSQVLSQEWRCSWSSTIRQCSNYIWVINNFIACWGVSYTRDLTVTVITYPRLNFREFLLVKAVPGKKFVLCFVIVKCLFLSENFAHVFWLQSLRVHCWTDNKSTLVEVMACRQRWQPMTKVTNAIMISSGQNELTHWGRVTHTYVAKLTIIGSDNGLSPERRQAIIWTSAGILLIGPLRTRNWNIFIEENTFENVVCEILFISSRPQCVNSLRPRQNGRHLAADIFKRIFMNENVRISIKFSLKFVPKGPINNIPALVQIMAWRRPGDKPLSEPVMVSLLTHICITRPQWVKHGLV